MIECSCGGSARYFVKLLNLPEKPELPICDFCFTDFESQAEEVNEHEIKNFSGKYGLVEYEFRSI